MLGSCSGEDSSSASRDRAKCRRVGIDYSRGHRPALGHRLLPRRDDAMRRAFPTMPRRKSRSSSQQHGEAALLQARVQAPGTCRKSGSAKSTGIVAATSLSSDPQDSRILSRDRLNYAGDRYSNRSSTIRDLLKMRRFADVKPIAHLYNPSLCLARYCRFRKKSAAPPHTELQHASGKTSSTSLFL